MTETDPQSDSAIYRRQGSLVAGLLMDTLRRELSGLSRRNGTHELLSSVLDHRRIGDMVRELSQTIPPDLGAIVRETSLGLDEESPIPRIVDADQALSNISTKLEVTQQLVRIFRILRTIYAATLVQDHSVEGCAALACVTYGRILEVVDLREATFESALTLRKDVIRALQVTTLES
ncbi:MAG TPA: hypothetical protein VLA77_04840 [Candidatus Saccharimonadales bacterium]|nr:hypothetical protein [Candidatus Saccharimonadales bacterium]